jgi:hypothetical protein
MSEYKLTRISDDQIIRFFKRVLNLRQPDRPTIFLFDNLHFSLDSEGNIPEDFRELFGVSTFLINRIMYNRDESPKFKIAFSRYSANSFVDKIVMEGQIGFGNRDDAINSRP